MVIDTSALMAILQNEPERRAFNEAIEKATVRLLSAATLVEASLVIESRYGAAGILDLDAFRGVAFTGSCRGSATPLATIGKARRHA